MPASRVCVNNDAGFVMHYHLTDLVTGNESPNTGDYPINQKICRDLSADVIPDLQEGDIIQVNVHANWGVDHVADTPVQYKPGAGTRIYRCTGATLTYKCELENVDLLENYEIFDYGFGQPFAPVYGYPQFGRNYAYGYPQFFLM